MNFEEEEDIYTISNTLPNIRLEIGGTLGVCFEYRGTMPNRWNRFWQRILLGFRWYELTETTR